jgi:hypothetical protein
MPWKSKNWYCVSQKGNSTMFIMFSFDYTLGAPSFVLMQRKKSAKIQMSLFSSAMGYRVYMDANGDAEGNYSLVAFTATNCTPGKCQKIQFCRI